MENKGWIDITVALENDMVFWPGDVPVKITKSATIDVDKVNVTGLQISAHTATHIDAPLHFIKDGGDVASLPIEKLIGKARVVKINNPLLISLDEIKDLPIQKGEHLLFKTRHSSEDWAMQPFKTDYVYLSKEAAVFLVEKEVSSVGVDYLSVGEFNNGAEVHLILLMHKVLIIEGLNLSNVEPGLYDFICLPLKIKDGDGAPARVLIRKINNVG